MDLAFQQMFCDERDRIREEVHDKIRQEISDVLPHSDFLVLDKQLTILVQPAVPIPNGYTTYWPVRPDGRNVVDLTLGVLLREARLSPD